MTTVDFYSKGQTDTLLSAKANTTDLPTSDQLVPATTSASVGDVLTIGNSGAEWSTPSGGDGWEEIDLTNLPTDFADTDILLINLSFDANPSGISSITSWSSSVSGVTWNPQANNLYKIIISLNQISPNIPFNIPYHNDNCIEMNYISLIGSGATWNSMTQYDVLLTISYMVFNGSGKKRSAKNITGSDIGTYIKGIKRMKTV